MKYLLFCVTILLCCTGAAQSEKNRSHTQYTSLISAGLLTGEAGQSLSVETINGLRKSSWTAGVGIGLDFYEKRSVPLFLAVQKVLYAHANAPFVYVHGGLNFGWQPAGQSTGTKTTAIPGGYYNTGAGYNLVLKHNRALQISIGYCYKQVREDVQQDWGAPTNILPQQHSDRYNYLYRRLLLNIGLQL